MNSQYNSTLYSPNINDTRVLHPHNMNDTPLSYPSNMNNSPPPYLIDNKNSIIDDNFRTAQYDWISNNVDILKV